MTQTYMLLSQADLEMISAALDQPRGAELKRRIDDRLSDLNNPAQMDIWSQYSTAAFDVHHVDGKLEIDDYALVSESDGGAYVMAWVWVSYDQAGLEDNIELICSSCGKPVYEHDSPDKNRCFSCYALKELGF